MWINSNSSAPGVLSEKPPGSVAACIVVDDKKGNVRRVVHVTHVTHVTGHTSLSTANCVLSRCEKCTTSLSFDMLSDLIETPTPLLRGIQPPMSLPERTAA